MPCVLLVARRLATHRFLYLGMALEDGERETAWVPHDNALGDLGLRGKFYYLDEGSGVAGKLLQVVEAGFVEWHED